MHPYNETIRQHFTMPKNVGALPDDSTQVGTGIVGMPGRSNVMHLQFHVDANGMIDATRFKAHGCGVAIATASWLSEHIKGMTIDQAMAVTHRDMVSALSIPTKKLHCALLAEEALQSAIANFNEKQTYVRLNDANEVTAYP